ncbi:MAG TPA: AAA family ATPase [Armatimonadota bacterium]|nr:AAA family ATPase [Armatimonadota bacterium]
MAVSGAVLENEKVGVDSMPDRVLIRRIRLQNLLSFGPDSDWIDLQPLNVLVGPNGVGKSNLLSAIDLLRAAPRDLHEALSRNGRIEDWIWKGRGGNGAASIEAVVDNPWWSEGLTYSLSFTKHPLYFQITKESVEAAPAPPGAETPYYVYHNDAGEAQYRTVPQPQATFDVTAPRSTGAGPVDGARSVLYSYRGPTYPEITYLSEQFGRIGFYLTAGFGPNDALKRPQPTDLPRGFVNEDGSNLSLVINRLRVERRLSALFDEKMNQFADDIEGIDILVEAGTIQIVARTRGMQTVIPMSRLSDGTIRYLCLLSILCEPSPPPLVCIEEPELGLHPDILPGLVDLMVEASSRTQLVVTTHSDIILDALTSRPQSVLVAEKEDGQTHLKRLDEDQLRGWLNDYRLGQVWLKGAIGGTRW